MQINTEMNAFKIHIKDLNVGVGAIPPKPFQQGHSRPACVSDVTALTDLTTSTRLSQL